MHEYPYRTCAEIDLNKLQRNLQRLRALIGPDCRIMEVMKADAYGHGLRVCAEYAAPYVDWFAAATYKMPVVSQTSKTRNVCVVRTFEMYVSSPTVMAEAMDVSLNSEIR